MRRENDVARVVADHQHRGLRVPRVLGMSGIKLRRVFGRVAGTESGHEGGLSMVSCRFSGIFGAAILVTAIALPGTEEYAFCVTWAAPEVPRAGAVWGHALIIKAAELRQADCYEALLMLPRRPSPHQPDFARYLTPLYLDTPTIDVQARLGPRARP